MKNFLKHIALVAVISTGRAVTLLEASDNLVSTGTVVGGIELPFDGHIFNLGTNKVMTIINEEAGSLVDEFMTSTPTIEIVPALDGRNGAVSFRSRSDPDLYMNIHGNRAFVTS